MAAPGPAAPGRSRGALLGNGGYLRFLLCRGCYVTSQQMLAVAVGWDLYARTGDVIDLGLVGLFLFLPVLALSLPAGVMADRFDRRRIVGLALLLDGAAMAAIGLWFGGGGEAVWPVFLLLSASGTATALLHPALQSTLPKLVARDLFAFAIAGASSVTKLAQLAGPAAAGLLLATGGAAVYAIATALCLIGSFAILSIRTDLRITTPEPFGLALLFGGFRHIRNTPTVLAAISVDLVAVLFGGVTGLLPVYAVDILGVGPEALGVMRAMPAAGALAVGTLLAWRPLPWSVGRTFFASLAVFGVAILVFGLTRSYGLALAALVVYGGADMVSVYVRQSLIQLGTPDALRGRVSAVNSVMVIASNQLGDFRAGVMAAAIGAPAAVALGGAVTLGATWLWFRAFPGLREMEGF
ncbi:MAG: MFS transporter [Rhodobacteraceae bacterium]|nr:MFS transporter [Paracoccaceae bacterium]